ncbi:restriction endonuclease subunit S [Polaribacter sp. KT 15]|uniref:restriction endonuclease subunit S n=1 Tax=Polaribacter sp. KT 15 TaxID=1896175 RepID=UPI000909403D|nr:restriction endonuclease subunit S [Polaribacter sp. KT 15]SHM80477.1 type I restriction enzyme, S subunit [Polaribacter sp. KT 15]
MQLLEHFKELTIHPKNAIELKGLILQLAIQGKLTSKWRKDNLNVEVSNDLLKRIKHYNSEQLKLNKRRVNIPKGEIKKLNYLPKGWVKVVNYELFNLQKGKNPKDLSETVKKYIYQDIASLDRGNVRRYSDDEKAPKCKESDILVVCDGSRSGLILDGKPGIVGSTLAVIHTPPFIKDYIRLIFLQDFERANANMIGAAIPHLNTKGLLLTTIGLPPLEEQKEIVNVVETLFKEVEQLEQLTVERIGLKEDFVTSALNQLTTKNANQEWTFLQDHFKPFFNETTNIKKLRETVLQLAVQGKLTSEWRTSHPELISGTHHASQLLKRIQEEKAQLIADKKIKKEKALPKITKDEIPYELPEGWVWCRMQEIGLFERGKSKHRPRNDFRLFSDGKYPLVQTGDVSSAKKNGGIINTHKSLYNDFGLAQSRMWDKGTLCITIAANIAETGILGFNACFPDSVVGFTEIIDNGNSLASYVEYFITIMKSDLEKFAPSTAQKNINLGILYQLKFPLPPLEEQKAIVEKVNALMGLCDSLEQEAQQSQEHSEMMMQSCLREVFEGERKMEEV